MSVLEFEPVNQQSTAEMIADRLREALVRGKLSPGEQLGEAELAAQFGVSRGPVREATQRLVSEGLLHSIRHRGIFVIELSPADVIDIYRARIAVEGGALSLIMDGRRDLAAAALCPSVTAMTEHAADGDAIGVSNADQEFHTDLISASGSARLVRAARTLLIETRMCLGALQTTYPDLNDQVQEHVELRKAIASGPSHRAHRMLRAHLTDAVTRLTSDTASSAT